MLFRLNAGNSARTRSNVMFPVTAFIRVFVFSARRRLKSGRPFPDISEAVDLNSTVALWIVWSFGSCFVSAAEYQICRRLCENLVAVRFVSVESLPPCFGVVQL